MQGKKNGQFSATELLKTLKMLEASRNDALQQSSQVESSYLNSSKAMKF